MAKKFYLAKGKETAGPYTEEEIAELKAAGAYEQYIWIWDAEVGAWEPAQDEPPPPVAPLVESTEVFYAPVRAPVEAEAQPEVMEETQEKPARREITKQIISDRPAAAQAKGQAKSSPAEASLGVEALCYNSNRKSFITARVLEINSEECVLRLPPTQMRRPPFAERSDFQLMLFHRTEGRTEKLNAKLRACKRDKSGWLFEVQFQQEPAWLKKTV